MVLLFLYGMRCQGRLEIVVPRETGEKILTATKDFDIT